MPVIDAQGCRGRSQEAFVRVITRCRLGQSSDCPTLNRRQIAEAKLFLVGQMQAHPYRAAGQFSVKMVARKVRMKPIKYVRRRSARACATQQIVPGAGVNGARGG